MTEQSTQPRLLPTMGAGMLALYGLGSMLGAGVYGLVGKAAGMLGGMVWASFLIAMVAAMLTGLSYAALGSRYPRAGGAAYVIQRAFGRPMLSYVAGLCVVASGLTSMATGSRIVATNLQNLFALYSLPVTVIAVLYLGVLCAVVWRGLRESLWFNAICTVIEASGLILVIVLGARFWGQANLLEMPTQQDWATTGLLLTQSAVLTFFAFLGFEDTLNVTEEVKNPARNVPIGLIGAMLGATVLYLLIAVTAVSVVHWDVLAAAPAPLGAVMERAAPWMPSVVYTVVTIFAVANTALINFVMGSRLIFGMSRQGLLPKVLAKIHPTRNTPHIAAVAIFVVASILLFFGDVSQLAAATVILLLGVFTLMNVAQLTLATRSGEPAAPIKLPMMVPILGAVICSILLVVRATSGELVAPLIAGGLVVVVVVLYLLTRHSHRADETEPLQSNQ
ncbi:MAG: APC family permease [Steroidobacteraceae bacterium]